MEKIFIDYIIDFLPIHRVLMDKMYLISRGIYQECNSRIKLVRYNANFRIYLDIKHANHVTISRQPRLNLVRNPRILPVKIHMTGNVRTSKYAGEYCCFFAPISGYLYAKFGKFYWVYDGKKIISNTAEKFEIIDNVLDECTRLMRELKS